MWNKEEGFLTYEYEKSSIFWRSCTFDRSDHQFPRGGSDDQERIWYFYDFLCTAHLQHGVFVFQFRYLELYFSDPAGHHTDGAEKIFLPRLLLFLRSRTGIRQDDRRPQRMASDTAGHPGFSYPILHRRIYPHLLRYLPGQQLHAAYHPYGHLPSRSLRDHTEEI